MIWYPDLIDSGYEIGRFWLRVNPRHGMDESEIIAIIFLITGSIAWSLRWPARYWIIRVSAVNNRFGRMLLSCRSDPDKKWSALSGMEYWSVICLLVIWQRRRSSPPSAAITSAGRFLALLKSEKAKEDYNYIAFYKSAHASSSSGRNQSFFKEDSLAYAVPFADFFCRDLIKWRISW